MWMWMSKCRIPIAHLNISLQTERQQRAKHSFFALPDPLSCFVMSNIS